MKTPRHILIALLTLVAFTMTQAATVTGRSAKTTPAGTEKIPIDDSGTDKYITIANLTSNAVITGGTITGTTISGLTVTTSTGTLTIPSGVTLTGPATTGTVATLAGAETLTNKSINLTSNTLTATSAQLLASMADATGSGLLVFATTPTLTTPVLGVATATSINKVTITAPATSSTLTVADGKTLTASNTLTFTGTDSSSVAFGAGGTVAYTGTDLSQFAATTSAQLAGVLSNETGSGLAVFATSPTLTTPTLGVATATSINKMAITAPATSSTLAVADGKTLTASNTLTFTGTDSTSFTFPATSNTVFTSSLSTNDVDAANAVWGVSNGLVFEGATADAFETTISPIDPTADQTVSIPNFAVNWAIVGSTLTTNKPDAANSFWGVSNGIVFEGATADASEITLQPADPTADVTYLFPNAAAASYAVMSSTLTTNAPDIANSVFGVSNGLNFEGATADGFETTVTVTDPTVDATITIPNKTGTVTLAQASTSTALTADNQVVTPGQNTRIQLTSDNATATSRTFTLSATGATTGQIYVIIGPATNQCEIAVTGIQMLSATWSPTTSDTLTVMFDGTNFYEIARSNN